MARIGPGLLAAVTIALATPASAPAAYRFVNEFGAGQFDIPYGIAVDGASGNVFVTDGNHAQQVEKFSAAGAPVSTFGSRGEGDGQFAEGGPVGIAAADGFLYVTDNNNDRIGKFTVDGGFQQFWGYGVVDGRFSYQTCAVGCMRGRVGGTTSTANVFAATSVAAGGGFVYLGEGAFNRIEKLDTDGNFVAMWGWGVKTGAAQLEVCTAAPCQSGSAGSGEGQFNGVSAVAVDGQGNVYATDGNHRVQKFTSTGAFVTQWGSQGSSDGQFLGTPDGIAIDRSGDVYVVDDGDYRVEKFTSTGRFITKFGTHGTGRGEFALPLWIAIDPGSGDVYVLDSSRKMVLLFRDDGSGAGAGPGTTMMPVGSGTSAGFPRNQRVLANRKLFVLVACPASCTAVAAGNLRIGSTRRKLKTTSKFFDDGIGVLTLRLTRAQASRARAALRRGSRVVIAATVTAIDGATGATSRGRLTYRVKR